MARNIVTIRKIDRIDPIEGADRIVAAVIGGWRVVVGKGEFNTGDDVLFFEVDSFLPETVPEFAELVNRGRKTTTNPNGDEVTGHVLKTAKLRGVFSQGLVKHLNWSLTADSTQEEIDSVMNELGVFKWEPPLPMGGQAVGSFPSVARKTDAERIQNLPNELLESLNPEDWFATEKVDGTSSTFVMTEDGLQVASRNWSVDPVNSLQGNLAERLGFADFMPVGSIIQGEVFGEGIQGNPLKIQGTRLVVFNSSLPAGVESPEFTKFVEKNSVPVVDLPFPKSIDEGVEQVNGMKSKINPKVLAEGVVWWNKNGEIFEEMDSRPNFKEINNKYLLKRGE